MIIGVTHDQDDRVVQRLSVSTKVSIGLPPNGDRKPSHQARPLRLPAQEEVGQPASVGSRSGADPALWRAVPRTSHYADRR